jgi:hypothetical protein
MDYNNATAQECADWLAGDDGWTWRHYAGDEHWRLWTLAAKNAEQFDHPYPLTLDSAAGALREPWEWDSVCFWTAHVDAYAKHVAKGYSVCAEAPDELTARYRAAVASRMEGGKA